MSTPPHVEIDESSLDEEFQPGGISGVSCLVLDLLEQQHCLCGHLAPFLDSPFGRDTFFPCCREELIDLSCSSGLTDTHEDVAQELDGVDLVLDPGLDDTHEHDGWFAGILAANVHPILPADGNASKRTLSGDMPRDQRDFHEEALRARNSLV